MRFRHLSNINVHFRVHNCLSLAVDSKRFNRPKAGNVTSKKYREPDVEPVFEKSIQQEATIGKQELKALYSLASLHVDCYELERGVRVGVE